MKQIAKQMLNLFCQCGGRFYMVEYIYEYFHWIRCDTCNTHWANVDTVCK